MPPIYCFKLLKFDFILGVDKHAIEMAGYLLSLGIFRWFFEID